MFPPERSAGAPALQRKPSVSEPSDPLEREADAVAEGVMRGAFVPEGRAAAGHALMRKCAQCGEEEEEKKKTVMTQRAPGASAPTGGAVDAAVHAAGRGGAPLPQTARAFFESRFGRDFGAVRVHAGGEAPEAARAVQARAFTVGRDIVFAHGQYAPETSDGRRLLAHELTHVVQQGAAGPNRVARTADEGAHPLARALQERQGAAIMRDPAAAAEPATAPGGPQASGASPAPATGYVPGTPNAYVLALPPKICEDGCYCWAASAASFQRVRGINPEAGMQNLIVQFGGCIDDEGCLLEVNVTDVYAQLGIHLEAPPSPLDFAYLDRMLRAHGHLVLLTAARRGDMGHAVIAYGVGVPDRDHVSIFDPAACDYTNRLISRLTLGYVGWGVPPTGRAPCTRTT